MTTCYLNITKAYNSLGKYDLALPNLQKAIDLGFDDLEWLKTDDSMDGLRNEPAFVELLKQLKKSNIENQKN